MVPQVHREEPAEVEEVIASMEHPAAAARGILAEEAEVVVVGRMEFL
jgi:hypothetical protein